MLMMMLNGHCHGNFAVFRSKLLKYLTKSLFFNMKLLIQHWEENTKVFLSEEQTIVIYHKGSVSFVLSGRSNLILHAHCLLSKKAGLKQ